MIRSSEENVRSHRLAISLSSCSISHRRGVNAYIQSILLVCAGSSHGTQAKSLQRLGSHFAPVNVVIDLCPTCIHEVVNLVNAVLSVIVDKGIVTTWVDLCEAVKNKTGSVVLDDICRVGCEGVVFDEFLHIMLKTDIDPIYSCQLLKLGPGKLISDQRSPIRKWTSFSLVNDNGDAKFTNFGVTPATAPQGSTLTLDCSFMSVSGTGIGTISFDITDPNNQTTGDVFWFEEKKLGSYPEKVAIDSYNLSNCDSSTGKNGFEFLFYHIRDHSQGSALTGQQETIPWWPPFAMVCAVLITRIHLSTTWEKRRLSWPKDRENVLLNIYQWKQLSYFSRWILWNKSDRILV